MVIAENNYFFSSKDRYEYLKTIVLMADLTVLLIMAGSAIGGRSGMFIAFIFAAEINFASYWFSDKIVLKMYRAQ